jgi:hypothetical protein
MSVADFDCAGVALLRSDLHLPGSISTKRPEPDGSAATIDRSRRQKPEP